MKGIRFDASKIEKGKKPRYLTEPFVVEIADIKKTHIGAIAKVVSEGNTPHKEEFPPKLNLVLFTQQRITKEAVIDLRHELMDVNGVKALAALPSLDELRGKLVGLISAPATKIAGVLQAPAGQLARVLSARAKQSDAA